MNIKIKALWVSLLLLPILSVSSESTTQPSSSSGTYYNPRIELTGKLGYSSKKGQRRDIGRLGFVLPIFQKLNAITYISLIGLKDTAKHFEGNLGVGYRQLLSSNWIVGGYGFYDLRRTENANFLRQATFGAEALSENLEFRVNAYIPLSKEYELSNTNLYNVQYNPQANVANINVSNKRIVERAIPGFDVEMGGSLSKKVELFGAYYHFTSKGVKPVIGGRIRSNIHLAKWLAVELETNYDTSRKMTSYGGLRLSWDIGSAKSGNKQWIDRKMTQLPVRDIDIIHGEASQKNTSLDRDVDLHGGKALLIEDFNPSTDQLVVSVVPPGNSGGGTGGATNELRVFTSLAELEESIRSGSIKRSSIISVSKEKVTINSFGDNISTQNKIAKNEELELEPNKDELVEEQNEELEQTELVEDEIVEDTVDLDSEMSELAMNDVMDENIEETNQPPIITEHEDVDMNLADENEDVQKVNENLADENEDVQKVNENLADENLADDKLAQQNVDVPQNAGPQKEDPKNDDKIPKRKKIPKGMKGIWVTDEDGKQKRVLVKEDKVSQKDKIKKANKKPTKIQKIVNRRLLYADDEDDDVHSSLQKTDAAAEIRKAREERKRKAAAAAEERRLKGDNNPVKVETEEDPAEVRRKMHALLKDKLGKKAPVNKKDGKKKAVVHTGKAYSWDGTLESLEGKSPMLKKMLFKSTIQSKEKVTNVELLDYDKNTAENDKNPLVVAEIKRRQIGRFEDQQAAQNRILAQQNAERDKLRKTKADLRGKTGDELEAMMREGKNPMLIIKEKQRRLAAKNNPKKAKPGLGGGRMNFLQSIQKGKKLNKAKDKPKKPKKKKALSMIEQMQQRQKQMQKASPEASMARDLILGTTNFEDPKEEYENLDYEEVMKIVNDKYKNSNRVGNVRDNYQEYKDEWAE